MEPTFPAGSKVFISPLSFIWRSPRRGEVVGLYSPEDKKRFELKRIIGLPGETVTWEGGMIRINNIPLPEPYASKSPAVPGEESQSLTLGSEDYFVAGDNRLHSHDSRLFGPIRFSDIVGHALPDDTGLADR